MLVRHCLCRITGAALVAMLALSIVGCEGSKPKPPAANSGADHGHDHGHDHDELAIGTFAESVGTLRKFHDEIKTAFEAKKPDDGHDALHEIGHVLEALEQQVTTVAADKQEAAKQAVKSLFDGYGKIDKAMHDGEEVKYADLSDELSKSVAALEAAK